MTSTPPVVLLAVGSLIPFGLYERLVRPAVWKAGVLDLGLKEDGVDYAVDDNNKAILSAEVRAKADQAKADIISGKIQVHDYMSDNKCPT